MSRVSYRMVAMLSGLIRVTFETLREETKGRFTLQLGKTFSETNSLYLILSVTQPLITFRDNGVRLPQLFHIWHNQKT